MTCHVQGSRIVCRRMDGVAHGSILRASEDVDFDSRPWSAELLLRHGVPKCDRDELSSPRVGWIGWLQSLAPGGGTKTLEEIVGAMTRRGVRIIGLAAVPVRPDHSKATSDDVARLVRFYEHRGFVLVSDLPQQKLDSPPVMARTIASLARDVS